MGLIGELLFKFNGIMIIRCNYSRCIKGIKYGGFRKWVKVGRVESTM